LFPVCEVPEISGARFRISIPGCSFAGCAKRKSVDKKNAQRSKKLFFIVFLIS